MVSGRGSSARAAGYRARVPDTERPRGSLASHTVLVAGALGLAQVLAYLVSVVSARVLGPDAFGVLAALLGIILIGNVVALGLQAVAARHVVLLPGPDRGGAAASILRTGLLAGVGVAAATLVVSPFLMWLLRIDQWWPIALVGISFIPLTWAGAQLGVAQGRENYARLAAVYAAIGVGKGVGGVAGALLTGSVLGTIVGLTVGTSLGALAGWLAVAPLTGPRRPLHIRREVMHASHALLALFVLTNIDVLLARALLTPAEAGDYGVGAVIAKVAFWLPQFIGVVAFPRFADERRGRATLVAVTAVATLGAVVVAGTALLPGLVVGIVGGSQYASLVPVAWMFAAIGALFAMGQALLLTRLAVDDRRAVFAVWAAAAVLVVVAVAIAPRTVSGLASGALVAGAVLVVVGVITTARERRLA